MEDLRRHFSSEAIKKLETLNSNLQNGETFSDSDRREVFRTLHTIKGTSQTFYFASASRLAHELENLLAAKREAVFIDEKVKNLFVEGIGLLVKCLRQKDFEIPASFSEKIRAIVPGSVEKHDFSETALPKIPPEIASQLSGQEKSALFSALNGGKTLYVLEIGFDANGFAADFKKFRAVLSESGEIVAALPSSKFSVPCRIGFQIVFVSYLRSAAIQKIAEKCAADVILDASETDFSNDLQGVLAHVVKHGRLVAEKFGKRVEFAVSADELKLSAEKLRLVFDLLVHLIRNAVDHAIETEGKIEITLKVEECGLRLCVLDDGRGIDLQKVKAKAVEKNLISADARLTEQETLDLIFLPEFSTAAELTEISGRGIGLDAVKSAVEAASGKINVKSQSGKGTTFEIFLSED